MSEHVTLKEQDSFRIKDSIFTVICLVIILALFFSLMIFMFLY